MRYAGARDDEDTPEIGMGGPEGMDAFVRPGTVCRAAGFLRRNYVGQRVETGDPIL